MIGRIHSVQTLGTLDGPGVRFVLFMQGCPLRCIYCHNPDTWTVDGGKEMTAEEVFNRVERSKPYFGKHGGITVSGGEPLLQAEFVRELFTLCKQAGIHTVLDTSGCILNEQVHKLLDVTDMVLLDYKFTDADDYKKYTRCEQAAVDRFLQELDRRGIDTWLRQVILQGYTDDPKQVGKLFAKKDVYPCIQKIELLPFRKLCSSKYEALGIDFPCKDIPETAEQTIQTLYGNL